MLNIKLLKEEDINHMLKNEEKLRCKLFALISIDRESLAKLKELNNIDFVIGSSEKSFSKSFCCFGVTKNDILITVINSPNTLKVNSHLKISLDKISSIEIKKCLICKNSKIKITLRGNVIINLNIINSNLLCGGVSQKLNSLEFFKILAEL